jgi:hypothetical protein
MPAEAGIQPFPIMIYSLNGLDDPLARMMTAEG